METRDMFVKALLVGIYNRSNDLEEDLFYTALMNKIEVEPTTEVPTAAATFSQLKPKILVNIDGLRTMFGNLDAKQMITLYRAVIKHELLHIYLGHLFLPTKIVLEASRLKPKLKKHVDLPEIIEIDTTTQDFRKLFNLAADSIINEMIKELKALSDQEIIDLIPAEEFMTHTSANRPALFCGTELLEDCTAEELAAVLYCLWHEALQGQAAKPDASDQIPEDMIGEDIRYTSEQVRDIAEQVWKEIVQEVSEISKRGLDKITLELRKKLTKKGQINWRQQLKAEIWGEISDQFAVSKHRISKRTGLPPKISRRPSPTALAFIDTSGSISDRLLDAFLHEISKLKADTNAQLKAVFYSVNATMQKIKKPTDVVTIAERGGTDLQNALQQVAPKEFAMIDALVVFTDGYDRFPAEELAKIGAKKIFVLPKEHDTQFSNQARRFGKVIIIED